MGADDDFSFPSTNAYEADGTVGGQIGRSASRENTWQIIVYAVTLKMFTCA